MKKMLKVLMLSCLLVGSVATASAKEISSVEPRLSYCGGCGEISLLYLDTTVVRATNEVDQRKCSHGNTYGTDLYRKYDTEKRYSCSNCGIIRVPSYKWVFEKCGGYN